MELVKYNGDWPNFFTWSAYTWLTDQAGDRNQSERLESDALQALTHNYPGALYHRLGVMRVHHLLNHHQRTGDNRVMSAEIIPRSPLDGSLRVRSINVGTSLLWTIVREVVDWQYVARSILNLNQVAAPEARHWYSPSPTTVLRSYFQILRDKRELGSTVLIQGPRPIEEPVTAAKLELWVSGFLLGQDAIDPNWASGALLHTFAYYVDWQSLVDEFFL
jgi:hypothetical protein